MIGRVGLSCRTRCMRNGFSGSVWSLLLVVVAACGWVPADVFALDQRIQMDESNFDRNVLGGTEVEARNKCKNAISVRIAFVELSCQLTLDQRKKLELAGGGDVERFFCAYKHLKSEMKFGSLTMDEWNAMWQKMSPLQTRFQAGLHEHDSLLMKTVSSTLDHDQLEKFQDLQRRRAVGLYGKYLRVAVQMIEQQAPLTIDQRTRLTDLLLEKADLPGYYGDGRQAIYLVLYTFTTVPQDELQAIFSDIEWTVVERFVRVGNSRGLQNMNWIVR